MFVVKMILITQKYQIVWLCHKPTHFGTSTGDELQENDISIFVEQKKYAILVMRRIFRCGIFPMQPSRFILGRLAFWRSPYKDGVHIFTLMFLSVTLFIRRVSKAKACRQISGVNIFPIYMIKLTIKMISHDISLASKCKWATRIVTIAVACSPKLSTTCNNFEIDVEGLALACCLFPFYWKQW